MSVLWNTFMQKLADMGKLDEFVNIEADDVDRWLEDNGLGVSVDQLVAALPKKVLDDSELDDVAGGKFVMYSVQEWRNQI